MCSDCESLKGALKSVPPHAQLAKKGEAKYKTTGWHTGIEARYTCKTCGTKWTRDTDKQDDHAGWIFEG